MRWDAIIVGAGAAGLFCAGILGQRGRRVLVLDHASILGEKIRISGGGRCNFTNRDSHWQNFLSLNPSFPKSALSRYRPVDFIDLVRRTGIGFHEKHRGQLFCNDSATQIVDLLRSECGLGGVTLRHPVTIHGISRESEFWRVESSLGGELANALVIATGGLPVPALGATSYGLDLARLFGLAVVPPRPGLVPLALTSPDFEAMSHLAGLSLPVSISSGSKGGAYGAAVFQEDLLITHKGLSGPAVLQASNYWEEGQPIFIDWAPDMAGRLGDDHEEVGPKLVESVLADQMPERLARYFAQSCGLAGRRWAEVGKRDRVRITDQLHRWLVKPAGTLGWKKAEVMLGGVDTRAIDSKTMMAKSHPGLYFIGECVDVTGHLGGHNFQWAWASAHACAQSI
jgi:predicted Rossmann fold flavoprotein